MQAGKLRHRATVQRRQEALDSRGQLSDTWQSLFTIRCAVETGGGGERESANKNYATGNYVVHTRWNCRVNEKDRLCIDGRILEIGNVENVNLRNREMILSCTEVKP